MSLSFRNYSEFSKWIKYHFPEFENKDGIFEQLFHILAKRDTNHEVYEQMGDIYLELTGSKQKSDWGQFYTPKSIIHLMIGLLSITKEDRILDPSCGSGYFLYNVFNFLLKEEQTLKSSEFHDHNRLDFIYSSLGNMRGIDIQEVPVYLARISILSLLIENNPKSGELPLDTIISTLHEKIHTKDFFSLKLSDDEQEKYDIIIGNPPYVRQRNIKNKKKVRS